ncbi:Vanillin dehydrogenase [Tolypocladium paradoxum]|uniref:Vanillin dehydrogenase n=1 Tax=Tolypocladium paradoxum TaxID=94208 RepID=A0A2S4KWF2_9HYPO|nr:Vanillin dehydrogenase [Tolypocladium paradoxum]
MSLVAMSASGTEAKEPVFTVPLFINGKEHHPEKTFDVVSPATGKVAHRCGASSVADAGAAVEAAAEAFKTWRKTTPTQRRDIFLKAAEIMNSRREELAGYMREETGAAKPWCDFNLNVATDILKDIAGRIPTLEGSFPAMMDPDTSGIIMREPYGVVLSVAPWNTPYILGTRSVAFPIAAGNTSVLKGTEAAPRTTFAIASVFHEAGLPNGVLNVIIHEPSAGAAVTSAIIANPPRQEDQLHGQYGCRAHHRGARWRESHAGGLGAWR